MPSNLIVAKMHPEHAASVAGLFTEFDKSEMPWRMGTLRRQLFTFHGLYFHLQDYAVDDSRAAIEEAKTDPRFQRISADLRPFIEAYDQGWRSPSDAMADCFYTWQRGS